MLLHVAVGAQEDAFLQLRFDLRPRSTHQVLAAQSKRLVVHVVEAQGGAATVVSATAASTAEHGDGLLATPDTHPVDVGHDLAGVGAVPSATTSDRP